MANGLSPSGTNWKSDSRFRSALAHFSTSLRTPFRTAMQGKHQLSIDERKKAINVHRTGLMVGIMLVCLTVNGPGH